MEPKQINAKTQSKLNIPFKCNFSQRVVYIYEEYLQILFVIEILVVYVYTLIIQSIWPSRFINKVNVSFDYMEKLICICVSVTFPYSFICNKLTSSNIPSGNRGSVSPRDKRTGSAVRATYEGKLTPFRSFCNFGSTFSTVLLSNPWNRRRSSAFPPSARYNLE